MANSTGSLSTRTISSPASASDVSACSPVAAAVSVLAEPPSGKFNKLRKSSAKSKQPNSLSQSQPAERRKRLAANARERKRMHLLNKAYDALRRRLVDAENKSKYDVLVQAKEYIQALAQICENFDKQQQGRNDVRPVGKIDVSTLEKRRDEDCYSCQLSVSPAPTTASSQPTPDCLRGRQLNASMSPDQSSSPVSHYELQANPLANEQSLYNSTPSPVAVVKQESCCFDSPASSPVAAPNHTLLLSPQQLYSYQQRFYSQINHQRASVAAHYQQRYTHQGTFIALDTI